MQRTYIDHFVLRNWR